MFTTKLFCLLAGKHALMPNGHISALQLYQIRRAGKNAKGCKTVKQHHPMSPVETAGALIIGCFGEGISPPQRYSRFAKIYGNHQDAIQETIAYCGGDFDLCCTIWGKSPSVQNQLHVLPMKADTFEHILRGDISSFCGFACFSNECKCRACCARRKRLSPSSALWSPVISTDGISVGPSEAGCSSGAQTVAGPRTPLHVDVNSSYSTFFDQTADVDTSAPDYMSIDCEQNDFIDLQPMKNTDLLSTTLFQLGLLATAEVLPNGDHCVPPLFPDITLDPSLFTETTTTIQSDLMYQPHSVSGVNLLECAFSACGESVHSLDSTD